MKKTAVLLCLSLLLYNTIGFVLNFQHALAEWRQEMRIFLKQNINENNLVKFTFKITDFDASTDEFSKDNKRFDVVKTVISGDTITVYCFQDDVEKELIAQFNDQLFQNTTSKGDFQKRTQSIFKYLRMEFVFENPFHLHALPPSVSEGKKSVLCYQNPYFEDGDFDILTPPPQFVG